MYILVYIYLSDIVFILLKDVWSKCYDGEENFELLYVWVLLFSFILFGLELCFGGFKMFLIGIVFGFFFICGVLVGCLLLLGCGG